MPFLKPDQLGINFETLVHIIERPIDMTVVARTANMDMQDLLEILRKLGFLMEGELQMSAVDFLQFLFFSKFLGLANRKFNDQGKISWKRGKPMFATFLEAANVMRMSKTWLEMSGIPKHQHLHIMPTITRLFIFLSQELCRIGAAAPIIAAISKIEMAHPTIDDFMDYVYEGDCISDKKKGLSLPYPALLQSLLLWRLHLRSVLTKEEIVKLSTTSSKETLLERNLSKEDAALVPIDPHPIVRLILLS